MPLRPLCVVPHRVLRARALPVETFGKELQRLHRDLVETMRHHHGVGLAAPQIGASVRLFVAGQARGIPRTLAIANPVLEHAEGQASVLEGCLSVPDAWHRIRRAANVRVRGVDLKGRAITVEAEGLLAIILQHELDHLDGTLFIDRVRAPAAAESAVAAAS